MPNYQPIIPPELQSEEEKKLLAELERNEVKLTEGMGQRDIVQTAYPAFPSLPSPPDGGATSP